MIQFKIALSALVLATVPTAAMAETQAPKREPVSINVSTEGLDLSSANGMQTLRGRMSQAIAAACNPGDRLNANLAPDWQCRREMGAVAEAQIMRIASQSSAKGRVASN